MPEPRALVLEDDEATRELLVELVRAEGFDTVGAGSLAEARGLMAERPADLLMLDVRLPDGAGTALLDDVGFVGDAIVVTGEASERSALDALRSGATDYLVKPVDIQRLRTMLRHVLRQYALRQQVGELQGELRSLGHFGELVGVSAAMQTVYDRLGRVAPTEAGVLITGETGTGKELVARAIHDQSDRAAGAFLAVNCAGLAEGVLESELFGHVKGSFTGASADREGLFRAAEGGTILLDEVGDMSQRLQQRLLRVLQEREVTPVGASRPVRVDVRVVAATRRDLREEAAAGRFRDDLFYRLNVFPIVLPPLRERHGDIPLLVESALERLRSRSRVPTPEGCTPAAMRLLRAWDWPGNVRELLGVVESAAIRSEGAPIGVEHLPAEIRDTAPSTSGGPADEIRYSAAGDEQAERTAIAAALDAAGGHRERAARMLGMSRTTLWRKMKDYGLDD